MTTRPEKIQTTLNTRYGDFDFIGYFWSEHDDDNVLAVVKRPFATPALVRIQSACYSGEIFESSDCDCHEQLEQSLSLIGNKGGAFIYLIRDGRGAGLKIKLQALDMWSKKGIDTADAYDKMGVEKDPRRYEKACYVLHDLEIKSVRLLPNNPRKVAGLENGGFTVYREPLEIDVEPDSEAFNYLQTKATKLGHLLSRIKQRS